MAEDSKPRTHTTIVMVMPAPGQGAKAPAPGISLEAKVRDMLDSIESGHPSAQDWIALNKFYDTIKDRTDSRCKNLRAMIEPIMSKYGQHGVSIK